jgi:hypothetical protein
LEQFTTKKIILVSVFLLALVIVTAIVQIETHFNTYIAFGVMLVGTVASARFLRGSQE